MYGIDIFSNTGLRSLKDGYSVLECIYAGYTRFIPEWNGSGGKPIQKYASTWLNVENSNPEDGYIVAIQSGMIHAIEYTKTPKSITHIDVTSKENSPRNIYIFRKSQAREADIPNYGLMIRDEKNVLKYHSNLRSMFVIGYFNKHLNKAFWFSGTAPNANRKLAFIQVGDDTRHYGGSHGSNAYWNEFTASVIVNNEENSISTERLLIEDYNSSEGFPYPDFDKSNNGILYYIIDVTKIPINITP